MREFAFEALGTLSMAIKLTHNGFWIHSYERKNEKACKEKKKKKHSAEETNQLGLLVAG
jgi:hypothetical protein